VYYIPIENCLDKSQGSVYKLTTMVAKRAQELAEGAKPFLQNVGGDKPLRTALREIQDGYLKIEQNRGAKKQ
jgi:DNA-directed RNA polymerase omega subunit